jgi:uncharacterized protein
MPVLLEDEQGVAHGNDWAKGFVRGMGMRAGSWAELVAHEERGAAVVPMLALAHEHDADPELRPEPFTPEGREEILSAMLAGLVLTYRYFEPHRRAYARAEVGAGTVRRSAPKIRRNDPCPCGSGKKYKHCCGGSDGSTLH